MTALAGWALFVVGFTYWVSISAIFAPVRIAFARLHPLTAQGVYCPICTSFWVGCVLGATDTYTFASTLIANTLLSGFAAMGLLSLALRTMTGGSNPAWDAEQAFLTHDTQDQDKDHPNDSTASSKEVEGEHDG